METTQDYLWVALKVLGALGLLIYGMRMMSDALQRLAGPQLRHVLERMTTNRLTGMLTGALVTCSVQSSSATTVMTVSFVSAGLLSLSGAIAVIMGANIGTTLTAWIMSLGYAVDLTSVVFPAFLVGMVLIYKNRHRFVGELLFGVGFMFLSLVMLSASGKELDLEHNEAVVGFFASFDTGSFLTIVAFLAIGTMITCLVQSSAAVMAITILLCSTGVLPIELGIALVMGENIGTTATANLAALGANTQARRAALAHLLFNVFGVVWMLIVFYPFVGMVCRLVGYDQHGLGQASQLPVVLAAFHTCFNVVNTAILIGFIPQMERLVCWLLPDKQQAEQEEFHLQYIEANLIQTPEMSILQAQKETIAFGQRVEQMFGLVVALMNEQDDGRREQLYNKVVAQEEYTDRMEMEIARFLGQVSNNHLSDVTKRKVRQLMREIGELESIGDACLHLARTLNRRQETSLDFTQPLYAKMKTMTELVARSIARMNQVMSGHARQHSIAETYRMENEIDQLRQAMKDDNLRAVNEREYSYAVGSMYVDFVNGCEKLGDYVVNVVQARLGE